MEWFILLEAGMNSSSACFRCEAGTYQTGSGASVLKCIELQYGATWPDDLALTFLPHAVLTACAILAMLWYWRRAFGFPK